MSKISTHVLDQAAGIPARGIAVRLERLSTDGSVTGVANATTDDDGRVLSLLPDGMKVNSGTYRLTFETAAYWHARGQPSFFPVVTIVFEIADTTAHHHVPLLMSPFGYSTYRGS
jgi:5-hydroxyisourate hydrolase